VSKTIKQRRAQFFFQGLDGLAHRRLGQRHHLRRLGKPALAHHLDEDTQCSQVHRYSFCDWALAIKVVFIMPEVCLP
jgi:hypothetical protein